MSWLTEIIVRKTVPIASPSAQKCVDNFPPFLHLSMPRENGLVARKTGPPLSPNLIIISSATLSHSPCGLLPWKEYHFISDPGPKNDHLPGENLLALIETRLALNSHSCSLSFDHHEMSSNIDMKIIHPVKSCGCMLIFDKNSWTLLQSCNVVNPEKNFQLTHRQVCPKLCIVMNYWNASTCLPRQYLIVGSRSSFQGTTQNQKRHTPSRARDWWLLHHQSKMNVSMKNHPS